MSLNNGEINSDDIFIFNWNALGQTAFFLESCVRLICETDRPVLVQM